MKDDPSFIISELHNVYTYCDLHNAKLKNELREIILQIAAGLFETVYIRLVGIELEVIEFLKENLGRASDIYYSFCFVFNRVENIVDGR